MNLALTTVISFLSVLCPLISAFELNDLTEDKFARSCSSSLLKSEAPIQVTSSELGMASELKLVAEGEMWEKPRDYNDEIDKFKWIKLRSSAGSLISL